MHHTTRIHVMHKWCLTFVPYMLNDITLFEKGRLGYSLKQTDYQRQKSSNPYFLILCRIRPSHSPSKKVTSTFQKILFGQTASKRVIEEQNFKASIRLPHHLFYILDRMLQNNVRNLSQPCVQQRMSQVGTLLIAICYTIILQPIAVTKSLQLWGKQTKSNVNTFPLLYFGQRMTINTIRILWLNKSFKVEKAYFLRYSKSFQAID